MRGRIITSDHRIFELPVLLRWNITYTGGVPCDSYEVTCVYDRTMAELLHLAAGFLALDENGGVHACGVCKGTVKNSVGAGDSMVAGFVAGCETGDYDYALKLGTATGGATAFSEGLAKKELIAELLQQLM